MERKLISDIEELKRFVDHYLPELGDDEVYFVSLSARNKHLSTEERRTIGLSRTEMFARALVRSKEKFVQIIRRYECNPWAYLTKNNVPIPSKCVIAYVNINPSSALKATQEAMTEIQKRMFDSVLSDGKTPETLASLKKLDIIVMNAFQRQRGTRHFIDIDFDIPKDNGRLLKDLFLDCLEEFKVRGMRFFVVETKGGYHVVVDKGTINFNYPLLLQEMEAWFREVTDEKIEVVPNKNEMIPCPGTFQAGFPVIIREELGNWGTT